MAMTMVYSSYESHFIHGLDWDPVSAKLSYRTEQRATAASVTQTKTMKPQNVFVNYTHPAQQGDRRRRREVASYIGTYYRNRSKPAAKREQESLMAHDAPQEQAEGPSGSNSNSRPKALQMFNWRLEPPNVSPLALRDGTGLRVDPFSSYPVQTTERLPKALDYCTLVLFAGWPCCPLTLLVFGAYAPTHLLRSSLPPQQAPQQLLQNYISYAMQHPAMFESIITLSYASLHIPQWAGGYPDVDTARHYGSTLKRLREALSDEDEMVEDATFLAILGLISAEVKIPVPCREHR